MPCPEAMTIRRIFIEKFGQEEYESLSPRLKAIFERIDDITANQKPVTRKQIADALR